MTECTVSENNMQSFHLQAAQFLGCHILFVCKRTITLKQQNSPEVKSYDPRRTSTFLSRAALITRLHNRTIKKNRISTAQIFNSLKAKQITIVFLSLQVYFWVRKYSGIHHTNNCQNNT